jgi:glycerol transport system ATP-binding protein
MAITLSNVVKTVGAETHLYETSLTFEAEGFNVLLGETGAGKTTLIKLLAGLEKPTTGRIRFGERDMTAIKPQQRNVSLVHQFFINYPNMTVFENIASPLRVARMDGAEIDRRVRETADMMKLTPMLARRPHELSGGQQQRTALARAVVKESELVLLDEPLANLDYKLREELRDELPKLFAGRGATVVYATSEPGEALLLGGRTATMHEGRVTQFGRTDRLYREPDDLTTARVFSDPPINVAEVRKEGGEIVLDGAIRWPGRRRRLPCRRAPALRQPAAEGRRRGRIRRHGAGDRALRLGERRPFRPQRPALGLPEPRGASLQGGRAPQVLPRCLRLSLFPRRRPARGRVRKGRARWRP